MAGIRQTLQIGLRNRVSDGEHGSRRSVTELPVKNGKPPTPNNVVLPTQSVITWHRTSERMPPDNRHILIAVNGKTYRAINRFGSWRIDENTTLHRDPELWAELPTVPGGDTA